ncbi:MAG: diguanylate cyclase [Microthrixaceae bacterium]|nr:diguanylate cyclase [Microthrixaceae bacterium]
MSPAADAPTRESPQRLVSLATCLATPTAIVAILMMQRVGYFAAKSLIPVMAILVVTTPTNLAVAWWLERSPDDPFRIHLRAISTAVTTAGVIYAVGWGPMLVVAYAMGAAELLRTTGASTAKPHMLWCVLSVTAGEVGVQVGWFPSLVEPGLSHAIAATALLCLAIVARVLAQSAEATGQAKQALRDRGTMFEALIAHAADAICVISRDGTIQSMSPAVIDMLGYRPEEVVGRNVVRFVRPDQVPEIVNRTAAAAPGSGEVEHMEIEVRHRDSRPRLLSATISAPSTDWNDHVIVNLRDITRQRELEQQLRHDASHDALTGMMNRRAFSDACEAAYERASRHGWAVGMLYIDLDGFKNINDSFGHDLGDLVLVETSRRLTECVSSAEMLARLGGDEFAVLIESVEGPESAVTLAERILDVVAEPIPGVPDGTHLGASIGIAIRSSDGIEMANLMRLADEAMYCAKRNGRARWELDPDLRDPLQLH